MKKILNLLTTITLIGTITTSLVACNKSEYNEVKLKELKEKNNINIKDGILEWIAPEEKPLNKLDNKYYFVVWRGNGTDDCRIVKFKNNIDLNTPAGKRNINNLSGYNLNLTNSDIKGINLNIYKSGIVEFSHWWYRSDDYFKSVYCWNNDSEPNTPEIDNNGNIKNKY
ncbi:lipoprotein [Spiroplasma endosymbiont of Polydrusus cervinus]|uniref:lipoprotein n=1 Tax=Spiroplasma endosymbiont of Polydrusus cervinus TaxID=3066287 RepID=UPI0030D49E9C